jgi:hypothetical protein
MSFHEDKGESEETEVDENSRPSFFDITKDANALDKDLEASGFTRKEQTDLDKVCEPMTLVITLLINLQSTVSWYCVYILNLRQTNLQHWSLCGFVSSFSLVHRMNIWFLSFIVY